MQGSAYQLLIQAVGIITVLGWTTGTAYAVCKTINLTYGLRVSEVEEQNGLDQNEHGTCAYPDFFGVDEARDILDLETEQEPALVKEKKLKIELNPHNT